MAREGFEPSKPLGRQIYSLLRLTASLPRRYLPADAPGLTLFGAGSFVRILRRSRFVPSCFSPPLLGLASYSGLSFGAAGIVELAKGFEPPTG